jgi:hypothetical protein
MARADGIASGPAPAMKKPPPVVRGGLAVPGQVAALQLLAI